MSLSEVKRPTLGQICAELVDIARQMKADGASERLLKLWLRGPHADVLRLPA